MSLFSTIAHESPFPASRLRPKRMALIGIAASVAVVIALSVTLRPNVTDPAEGANGGQLTSAEFIDLNTVALVGLEPVGTAAVDNSFLYWNIGALEYASPAVSTGQSDPEFENFLYWNTDSLDYASPVYHQPVTGPR